jgi:hypothetical protein
MTLPPSRFPAAGRKHADAIELQDRSGYGDRKRGRCRFGFRRERCRFAVDPASSGDTNDTNAAQLPALSLLSWTAYHSSSPLLKVTIILSNAGDTGVEHCDHKFDVT